MPEGARVGACAEINIGSGVISGGIAEDVARASFVDRRRRVWSIKHSSCVQSQCLRDAGRGPSPVSGSSELWPAAQTVCLKRRADKGDQRELFQRQNNAVVML